MLPNIACVFAKELQLNTSQRLTAYKLAHAADIQTVVMIKQHFFLTSLSLILPLLIDNMSDNEVQMALAKRRRTKIRRNHAK